MGDLGVLSFGGLAMELGLFGMEQALGLEVGEGFLYPFTAHDR